MKIRAIELTNLRRFAGQRARIDGIGDGVSVLSQPNEFGKSTFFDGLHALFFLPHRGKGGDVRALQPHSGGAPEVSVEIELPEGRFRVEKRWINRATARILDASGRLIAQEDEAEAWISRLTGQGLAGPTGLLWVRQGLLGMDPDGADKKTLNQGVEVRRDLLSAFTQDIENMTGGRRMDRALTQVNETLSRLATSTLRPRANGEWASAVDEATRLAQLRQDLETRAARLSEALRTRSSLQRSLREVMDPEAQARDEASFNAASQRLRTAERHVEDVERAESAHRLTQLDAERGETAISRLMQLRDRLADATQELEAQEISLALTRARTQEATEAEATAAAQHSTAKAALTQATEAVEAARRAQAALRARDLLAVLTERLAKAESQRQHLEKTRAARAGLRATQGLVEAVDQALAQRDTLLARMQAQQVLLQLSYSGDTRIMMAGQPVGDIMRLSGPTRLDLPGIGSMTIDPGTGKTESLAKDLERAEAMLATALERCGAADAASARRALAEAMRLDSDLAHAQALLNEFAPEGLDVLQAAVEVARSEATGAPEGDVPDFSVLERDLDQARQREASASANRQAAEIAKTALHERLNAAQTATQKAGAALAALQGDVDDPSTLATQLSDLARAQLDLVARRTAAGDALEALRATAPDLATAKAEASRLQSVMTGRRDERGRLETALAAVNSTIKAHADEGIEEALEETRGREATALGRAARWEREVKALDLLRKALESARSAARDAYFGPVLKELDPLLKILHPDAALQIDDSSLLPSVLTRDGQPEELAILSGGTREQLAILTRLAFARLYAKSGRAVPVVLDDALVHSDDERIEAMFNALHRVAQGQQIIVLTCRQRAFGPLGGIRLDATIEPM